MRKAISGLMAVLAVAAFLSGCAISAKTPLEVLHYPNPDREKNNQRLIVFLRGMGGSHHSFAEEGFVTDVRACGLPYDIAVPNAHFGYYGDRSLIDRLKTDVIDPARARGCQKIWLIGISMGGLGAMLYYMAHPEEIEGIYLMAPFLGAPYILEEIEAAGGVQSWNPGNFTAEDDWQRMLWHWIKTTVADHPDKKIYLGYGSNDTYKRASELLAPLLPPDRVMVIRGAHDYATFTTLWKMFLENDSKLRD